MTFHLPRSSITVLEKANQFYGRIMFFAVLICSAVAQLLQPFIEGDGFKFEASAAKFEE